jgi:Abnormal spindle-like microcephaly-assoc'd, ASPM-SPD-2-Hydin
MERAVNLSSIAFALLAPLLTAQVKVAPANLTFSQQLINVTSFAQTVTVTNKGTSQLTVSSAAASGGFAATNNCSTVVPGESCTIDVQFISGLLGSTKGVLTIVDSDHSSPQLVNLSGSTVAALTFAPAQLTFGEVAVGAASQPKTLTVTSNFDSFPIQTIATSGNFTQSNNCPTTLAAGQSCTVTLSFVPTSVGTISGMVAVTGKNTGLGFSAVLSGTGTGNVASQVSLQPRSLNFGGVSLLDDAKLTKTITLINSSATTSLTIQSVSTTGPTSSGLADYQIASNTCKGMLAPGAQCKFNVTLAGALYYPISTRGSVTIVDSDPTSPQIIGLSATLLAEVTFSPTTLTFAPQAVGTTSPEQIVTITSNLHRDSTVSLVPLTVSGDFLVDGAAGANPCGLSPEFNPGGSCTLGVSFSPNHAGTFEGEVSFTFYPECSPELPLEGKPCPASQAINLEGTGQ